MPGAGGAPGAASVARVNEDRSAVEEWDAEAAAFDEPADHGLRDPVVRQAWRDLLAGVLPPAPARIADLGCGTATLSVLLADEGHTVDAVDFSPAMLALAERKTAGRPDVRVLLGDAADPPLTPASYDVVLCRHVLWALPDQRAALRRWVDLLSPGGRLVLVEGRWGNGAGLSAAETTSLVRGLGRGAEVTPLADPVWWGRPIDDERYLLVSTAIGAADGAADGAVDGTT